MLLTRHCALVCIHPFMFKINANNSACTKVKLIKLAVLYCAEGEKKTSCMQSGEKEILNSPYSFLVASAKSHAACTGIMHKCL